MNFITSMTLAIAVLGAVLGIINTIHSLNRDRILLKVIPEWVVPKGHDERDLGIRVINLSYIAVSVEEIGFEIKGEKIPLFDPSFEEVEVPLFDSGVSLSRAALGERMFPKRLEPRTSMTVTVPGEVLKSLKSEEFKKIKIAYAITNCGLIFKGSSGALRQAVYDDRIKDRGSNV